MQVNPKHIARNKLSILFMLKSCGLELRENQLIRLVADFSVMEYFELMRTLAELQKDGFIAITPSLAGSLIGITELGVTTLDFFKRELSYTWREKIDAYMEAHRAELRLEAKLFTEYYRIDDNEYRVTLRIIERNIPSFEVTLICTSKEEADRFARGWMKNAVDVYGAAVTAILKNTPMD